MIRPDPHALYAELAAGHALSALEPEEEQLFLAHVSGCARCERDVAEHRATLSHLAYAVDASEPPPSLLEGIRAGVLASGRGVSFPESVPVDELAARRTRRDPAAALRGAKGWTSVAAAAALVVGLGVWNVSLQSDRDQQDAWSGRITAAMRELGEQDTDTVPLVGDGGRVVAVALVHGDRLSLLVDGLKANDTRSSIYVLWGQSRFGDVRPVAAFDVTEKGMDVRDGMHIQAGVSQVTRFMITHENGRSAPPVATKPVLAQGDV